mmetsp:Transcript_698/g.904  ORF Transcript_698/g.904 Transcript_698/m.904 type:complete len:84 (+) Transcript_698:115-366(+)
MKNRPLDLHCVPEHGYGNASSINPEEAMQFVAVAVDDDYFCVCSRGNNEAIERVSLVQNPTGRFMDDATFAALRTGAADPISV